MRWPSTLWIVRHGESAGNVARDRARAAGVARIEIADRDVDVPLSALGEAQSDALGRWFADLPADARPDVVLASPYLRAQTTARLIRSAGGLAHNALEPTADERLREREFGVLDRLTSSGSKRSYASSSANSITAHPAGRAGATSSCACAARSTPSACTMPASAC